MNTQGKNHMKALKVVILSGLLAVGVTACSNQEVGTVGGAVVGGVVGSAFGGGAGKTAATIGGAVVGGVVGNQVGKSMDNN